ncbi:hypothetical protein [Lachnobacterium bovis]|uniref:ABC-2 family transporter protein n=1 Tax=Lachnobacterium bovis DSM 14045 TaxID=1122142 RepID=A0A1H3KF78_9FIRM|nr:hypothetical protein [Lachnobacterium bovis]SDY50679.1 hypothetical protein SAMN02910414_01704 [Lachnobacterium bovis DSM 14045]
MKFEIKKLLNRNELWIAFLVLLTAGCGDFIYTINMYRGYYLSEILTPISLSVLDSFTNSPAELFFSLLLPVISCYIGSSIAVEERNNEITACIYTRISKKKQIIKQGLAVAFMSSIVFTTALLVNLILITLFFPAEGINFFSQPEQYILSQSDYWIFEDLIKYRPILYLTLTIFYRSMVAGVFAWFGYGLSHMFKFFKKTHVIVAPFIVLTGFEILSVILKRITNINNSWTRIGLYCTTYEFKDVIPTLTLLGFFIITGAIGIYIGTKREDIY